MGLESEISRSLEELKPEKQTSEYNLIQCIHILVRFSSYLEVMTYPHLSASVMGNRYIQTELVNENLTRGRSKPNKGYSVIK